jgi:hypothetical protein
LQHNTKITSYGISFAGRNMKNPDKNLSGKSDEREVKICKNGSFTLYPSFFIFPSLRFLTPIPYL